MKSAALRGALSDRARHDRIHVVESISNGDVPSAKAAVELLAGLTLRKNVLVVLDRSDIVSMKSVRNIVDLHVLAVDQINTYDVLCADDIVFTKAAFDALVDRFLGTTAAPQDDATPVDVQREAGQGRQGPGRRARPRLRRPPRPSKAPKADKAPKAEKAAKADKPAKAKKADKADVEDEK